MGIDIFPVYTMTTPVSHSQTQPATRIDRANAILIFSPDPDIAKSLTMLLEEHYRIEAETNLAMLEDHINRLDPSLLLVDLYPLPPDILKTIEVLKRRKNKNPVVMFHVFRNSRPEIEQAIRNVSDLILYKPINAELVSELVSVLMAIHFTAREERGTEAPLQ